MAKKKKPRRSFDEAFKTAAVKRVIEGEQIAAVAKELELGWQLLKNWVIAASGEKPQRKKPRAKKKARAAKAPPRRARTPRRKAVEVAHTGATLDVAIAEATQALKTLIDVRSAYRRFFGGGA